jgi:hypothetical protein
MKGDKPTRGVRRALLIGSGIFRDPRLPSLPAAEHDVDAVAMVLGDPRRGGYAVTRRFNVESSRIRSEIENLLVEANRGDQILIYISGHGYLDEDGQLFFAAPDTDLSLLLSTAVEARLLATLMRRSPAAAVVVLLDCCHSGAFGFKSALGVSQATFAAGRGRAVLTATTATELAWEGKRVSIGSGLSVFTHHVVQGILTGAADVDGDDQISMGDLFDYVRTSMAGHQFLQVPTLIVDQLEGFPIISRVSRGAAPQPAAASSPVPAAAPRFSPTRVTLRHPVTIEFVPFHGATAVAAGHVSRMVVTESQMTAYLATTSRSHSFTAASAKAATNVSWFLAQQFCQWIGEQARVAATLPTEDELNAVAAGARDGGRGIESPEELWEWCSNWSVDEATLGSGAVIGTRKAVVALSPSGGSPSRGRLFPHFWYRNVGFRIVIR